MKKKTYGENVNLSPYISQNNKNINTTVHFLNAF